jgi:hypothetical protein
MIFYDEKYIEELINTKFIALQIGRHQLEESY